MGRDRERALVGRCCENCSPARTPRRLLTRRRDSGSRSKSARAPSASQSASSTLRQRMDARGITMALMAFACAHVKMRFTCHAATSPSATGQRVDAPERNGIGISGYEFQSGWAAYRPGSPASRAPVNGRRRTRHRAGVPRGPFGLRTGRVNRGRRGLR